MEDMIGKIIELDKQTRENAIKEKELRIDLEQKISDLKEKRRVEYLKRAEGDIKEIEKDEKIKACIKLSAIEGVNRKKIERIEEIYRKNKEAWAESIVKRVIEK